MPRIKLLRLFSFSTQETTQNSKKTSQCGSVTRTADGSSRSRSRRKSPSLVRTHWEPVRMEPAALRT